MQAACYDQTNHTEGMLEDHQGTNHDLHIPLALTFAGIAVGVVYKWGFGNLSILSQRCWLIEKLLTQVAGCTTSETLRKLWWIPLTSLMV